MCQSRLSLFLGWLVMMFRILRVASSSCAPKNGHRLIAFVQPSSRASTPILRAFDTDVTRYFSSGSASSSETAFFAPSDQTFESMGVSSPILLERIETCARLKRPSAVQAAAYTVIASGEDVTIGAETGSGKTLAYLLPIIDDILQRKAANNDSANRNIGYHYARAIILVPNKELVQQVVRMAADLCGGRDKALISSSNFGMTMRTSSTVPKEDANANEIVRLAVMPGELDAPLDFQPFRQSIGLGGNNPPVDIVISTPAAIGPLGLRPKNLDMFADIQTLVIDEADMLLDGGYFRQLENVLMGFRRADRLDASLGVTKTQHVFCAATLPDMGLRSVDAYLQKRFPNATRVTMAGMHNAKHYGLRDETLWIEGDGGNRERMEQLVEMLQTPRDKGGLKGEKVMVFLNSVDDVDGSSGALSRAGIRNVPYHAKIKPEQRAENLDKFRSYSPDGSSSTVDNEGDDAVPVLVCTDLASRGLDVPGVTAIVQLQFAGNVVAHLHRMGRCGRAGNRNGRGIVFYTRKERELVEVVREAELQQERMILEGDVEEIDVLDDSEVVPKGSVKNAFSRKRGFTKKRKKLRRDSEPA